MMIDKPPHTNRATAPLERWDGDTESGFAQA